MKRYGDIIKDLIVQDNRYYVLTAENMGPIYYIMDDIRDNYLDVGIAEQNMLGVAAGLAIRGRIPIVHAMSSFLVMRAFEFIRTDIGYGNLNVKLVGTAAGLLSEKNGATHQCVEDIALMHSIPNMHIYAPADNDDMIKMQKAILKEDNPSYMRYNDSIAKYEHADFTVGKSEVIGNGKDFVIITYGIMFATALELKELLHSEGSDVTLINLRAIVPLDEETIVETVKRTKSVVVIEDHLEYGGVSTMLRELLYSKHILKDLYSFSLKNYFKPGDISSVLCNEGLSAEAIYNELCNCGTINN